MKKYRYIIRDKEAGNYISTFQNLEDAKKQLNQFEKEDKKDGIYTPDFYEIYDVEKERIIDL